MLRSVASHALNYGETAEIKGYAVKNKESIWSIGSAVDHGKSSLPHWKHMEKTGKT